MHFSVSLLSHELRPVLITTSDVLVPVVVPLWSGCSFPQQVLKCAMSTGISCAAMLKSNSEPNFGNRTQADPDD